MYERRIRLAAAVVLAAMDFAIPGEALAAGFQVRENSAAALGTAFAGAAVSTDDPSIIANNPAGMTGLAGNRLSGDLSIVIPTVVFSGIGVNAARQPIWRQWRRCGKCATRTGVLWALRRVTGLEVRACDDRSVRPCHAIQ